MSRILVTGATTGIGQVLAEVLAEGGHALVLADRDTERLKALRGQLSAKTGATPTTCGVDLGSLVDVRQAAYSLVQRQEPLDGLVNVAGPAFREPARSADGLEATFAVHVRGPFLWTALLRPLLEAAPRARIVDVAGVSAFRGELDLDDLFFERRGWRRGPVACTAQQARVLLVEEWARRLPAHVTINAVDPDPGVLAGLRSSRGRVAPILRLLTDPELEGVSGHHFRRFRRLDPTDDPALTGALWQRCAELVE